MIFIEIRCDKCHTVGISRHCFYAHQLRKELKGQGWKCIGATATFAGVRIMPATLRTP